ncbi:MAG TPA: Retron-type reverse transcriptase [Dehalococcoidia bacterium]|nr:Retron-type reverse transcriptase [Dehalococcoidia bacterium]
MSFYESFRRRPRREWNERPSCFAGPPDYAAVSRHRGSWRDFKSRLRQALTYAGNRGDPELKVPHHFLLGWIADAHNLYAACDYLHGKGGSAPGPNGLRFDQLSEPESWSLCRALGAAIREDKYRHGPVRTVSIPKGNNRGNRKLAISNIQDRVVSRAILEVLQPLTDPGFDERSFGFRPGRGREKALAAALALSENRRTVWIVEDLRDAFDKIPISRLKDVLTSHLPKDVVKLIERTSFTGKKRGIRQGAPLSPFLMNVYLDHFLDQPWRKEHPEIPLLRTADDILLLCRNRTEAELAYRSLERLVTAAGMPLKGCQEENICSLHEGHCAKWLGYLVDCRDEQFRVRIGEDAWVKLRDKLALTHEGSDAPLKANQIVRGWISRSGPTFSFEDRDVVCRRIKKTCDDLAFDEIDDSATLNGLWQRAHAQWLKCRRKATPPDNSCPATTEATGPKGLDTVALLAHTTIESPSDVPVSGAVAPI